MHCGICDITYIKRHSYLYHLGIVHYHMNVTSESVTKHANTVPNINDPNNQCIGCKRIFDYKCKSMYNYHLSIIYMCLSQGELAFSHPDKGPDHHCCVCKRKYKSRSAFKLNLRIVHIKGLIIT